MWLHKNKVINKIEDFPKNTFGFIYKITNNETGKFYIGKKQLMSKTNVKLGKKEKAALPTQRGRTPSKKLVVKEADWQNYWSSNKPLLKELKSHKDKFTREILMVCSSKKMLTYWETAFQIKLDVLTVNSYNETVLGKFFKGDFT